MSAPGRWTPHVTLSHRLPRSELPHALEVLAADDLTVRLDAARRWDKASRRDWVIA
jgi:hypothetical protein